MERGAVSLWISPLFFSNHEIRIFSIPDPVLRRVPGAPAIRHDAEAEGWFLHHQGESGNHEEDGIFQRHKDSEEINEDNVKDGGGVASAPDDAHARAV
jgi:hypothetical protein